MNHGVTVPPAQRILATLRPGHPRLLATADQFAQIRQRVRDEPAMHVLHQQLVNSVEQWMTQPPYRYELPDGTLLQTSRGMFSRISTLGLLYQIDADRRYADRAWAELAAATTFADWHPAHFLETAGLTFAFALGYDWLYDAWTDDQRRMLRQTMTDKGLNEALRCYRGQVPGCWWIHAEHNWNQVCNGGIAIGALAIADEQPELAAELVYEAVRRVPGALSHYAPDGGWSEGPVYWQMATRASVDVMAALQSALGTDFGLSAMPGLDRTGFFPAAITGPTRHTFNYADGPDDPICSPVFFWLAQRYQQPALAEVRRQQLPPCKPDGWIHPFDLLWHPTTGDCFREPPTAFHFRGIEVASMRSDWFNDATFTAFKAGDNRANHGHLDLGTFVLDAMGKRWAIDMGRDSYRLPGYFGSDQRWTYYRARAEGHNTLVVDPSPAPDQSPDAKCEIVRFSSSSNRAFGISDLTRAYHTATSARRGYLLDGRTVLIRDELQLREPGDVYWFMHTRAGVTIADDGRNAMLSQDEAKLRVELLSPADARLEVMDAAPLAESIHPPEQAANPDVRKLMIRLHDVRDVTITVRFVPTDGQSDNAGAGAAIMLPLAEW